ncbi:DUF7563 family protein [Natronorubrum sp. FCH18a]
MPHCSDCDAFVTRDFIRVFGVNGEVNGCPSCMTYRKLHQGRGIPSDFA